MVVLDTDVVSQMIRGRFALPDHLADVRPAITSVTLGELVKWVLIRHWGPRRLAHFLEHVSGFVIIPLESGVAAVWGVLEGQAQMRGRPRPVNDSWIAAYCVARDLPLVTLNTKDFEDSAQYDGLKLLPV
jgi:predicted nucleic acid-binding protein